MRRHLLLVLAVLATFLVPVGARAATAPCAPATARAALEARYAVAAERQDEASARAFATCVEQIASTSGKDGSFLDRFMCPILISLSPGIPGILDIDSTGDLVLFVAYQVALWAWDCPPYGS